jgi:hypothetical protein
MQAAAFAATLRLNLDNEKLCSQLCKYVLGLEHIMPTSNGSSSFPKQKIKKQILNKGIAVAAPPRYFNACSAYPATIHDSSRSLSRAWPGERGMFRSAKLSMLAHDLDRLCRRLALLLPAVW